MRNLYKNNIFHISANTKFVKGDGDVMLEKMVEEAVERKMLELVGDRDNVVDRYIYSCPKTKACMEWYGYPCVSNCF